MNDNVNMLTACDVYNLSDTAAKNIIAELVNNGIINLSYQTDDDKINIYYPAEELLTKIDWV